MASATVRRLKAHGSLIEGRTVICLGHDVDTFFRKAVRDIAGLHTVKAYHPSNLTAKGRKTTHGWQHDARCKNELLPSCRSRPLYDALPL
jgi:hypothetical protein